MTRTRQRANRFTLELAGLRELSDDQLNALFAAGCDDATFGAEGGALIVNFDRKAPSFAEAVNSARWQIEGTVPRLRVVRIVVENEDLVTASEIARRAGLTREGVRLLATGARGPRTFPTPRATLGRQRLWHWPDVAAWFARERGAHLKVESDEQGRFVHAFNEALDLRSQRLPAGSPERKAVSEIVRELVRA
ncbi:MAG: hypothetical protein AAB295_02955 [Chloroflexota bacterium]